MKFILLSVLGTCCIAAASPTLTPQNAQLYGTAIFDELCVTMKIDDDRINCSNIQPPITILSKLVDWVDVNGRVLGVFVWDEPYVFISTTSKNIQSTMRHEIAHYIRWYSGASGPNVCVEERTVRSYAGQPWDDVERAKYNCSTDDIPIPRVTLKIGEM